MTKYERSLSGSKRRFLNYDALKLIFIISCLFLEEYFHFIKRNEFQILILVGYLFIVYLDFHLNQGNIIIPNPDNSSSLFHQFGNQLQLLLDFLHSAIEESKTNPSNIILQKMQSRIIAISDLYKMQNNQSLSVDIQNYLLSLLNQCSIIHDNGKVETNIRIEPIQISKQVALNLGLVLIELVSNSYLHAFANQKLCTIDVHVRLMKYDLILEINDNGKGFNFMKNRGIGLSLTNSIVGHLQGDIKYNSQNGSRFKITIPRINIQ